MDIKRGTELRVELDGDRVHLITRCGFE
jgi:hypothetical protein